MFAIVNTFFNTITIGLTVWGFSFTPIYGGVEFVLLEVMVFSALISAVDAVAVLSTFVRVNVNDTLYIIVFGESLINDGVAVVDILQKILVIETEKKGFCVIKFFIKALYRLFNGLAKIGSDRVKPIDFVLGAVSFLVVACGGALLGIFYGALASMTTKFSQKTPILEPLIVVAFAYLCYLTCEMLSVSSVLGYVISLIRDIYFFPPSNYVYSHPLII